MLRFTADDVLRRPGDPLRQVAAALDAADRFRNQGR